MGEEPKEKENTTIQVSVTTAERIYAMKTRNQSYEDIIKRVLDFYDKHHPETAEKERKESD